MISKPLIAFLWNDSHFSPALFKSVPGPGVTFIYDVSCGDFADLSTPLIYGECDPDMSGIKLSPELLANDADLDVIRETGIKRLFVELHPAFTLHVSSFLARAAELSSEFEIVPILGDFDLIVEALQYPELERIALKGAEAGGFVSKETVFALYSAVREELKHRAHQPGLVIWGGIGVPEIAAAFLAGGAAGVVFESVHLGTDPAGNTNDSHKKLTALRPAHTDVIGLNLDTPCRVFDKGNSKVVKELRESAGSLCGAEVTDALRTEFCANIRDRFVSPTRAGYTRDELIPLGVEAGFIAGFVERFGRSTESGIRGFVQAVQDRLSYAGDAVNLWTSSPIAGEMGVSYPFVQGAMSWITDNPAFARKIAEAGGLPTIALGMMDEAALNEQLGNLSGEMGEMSYAVNVIALHENPFRNLQMEWIIRTKPRFAVIAAGEPSHAAKFAEAGIECIYIAPNEELIKLACAAGIKYLICEGNEAGGHIGQYGTVALAQVVWELRRKEPKLLEGRRIIFAGGICNRETAYIAAMMGADAVQMGTVYLASSDIVETGALSSLYQSMILESRPGGTAVTGESVGLRVRSLKTPAVEAICDLERVYAAGGESESVFRQKLEALGAGSLAIAARGIDKTSGLRLSELESLERGQFMSGSCAGAVRTRIDIASLHKELATGPLAEGLPFCGPLVEKSKPVRGFRTRSTGAAPSSDRFERIAITGMSVVNSLGNTPEEVWDACVNMRSGIVTVPPSKWDHSLFFHPRPRMPEKTYCKWGAFQDIEISRKDIGIPPQDFRTMTDATKITMWLAANAVEQSGVLNIDTPRERIAVLISQNSGEAAATLQDVIIRGACPKIVSAVKQVVALSPELEEQVSEAVKHGRIAIDDTTLLGRLNCSAGGFICNKYGFMGPSFSVSAACATALVALYSAYQMMRNGVIDAAVVGGAEEFLTPMHFLEFSALGALAGLSGREREAFEASRPFDADRDGMVLGEGGGVIVIERESVARKRGARIFGYITSMGASNNHLGMVESSRVTQQIAIKSSFADLWYGPEGTDMVECHATSTRQGDVEEVHALKTFYEGAGSTVLTSFKSQIGHTLGASGINSLIRGVMAMNAGVFAPTLNYRTPDPDMGFNGEGFIIHPEPVDWPQPADRPRRMQVNAFGFGGSNYVVQLEQETELQDTRLVDIPERRTDESSEIECGGVHFFSARIGDTPYRVAVAAESERKARWIVAETEPVNGGPLSPKRVKAFGKQNIFLAPETPAPKLAFVFPGQGSHYAGMSYELYRTFPVVKHWMDRAAEVADFDLLQLMFHDREEDLQKTRWQQPALFTMEFAIAQMLWSLGVRPFAMAGHSLGELTALCLAGTYTFEDGFRLVNKRAICMDKACDMHVDPGVMMAVDAPMDVLTEKMRSYENVYITNINSPRQLVAGGNTEQIKLLGAELKAMGHRNTLLRVSMAFHSPIMTCIHDELEEFIATIDFHPPQIPVVSNTTMEPFPADTVEIKRIVMAHLESPVHWMQNVRTLWNDFGIRLFVEIGPREVLTNLIKDTMEEAECIQTCLPSAEAVMFRNAVARLYAEGCVPLSKPAKSISLPSSSGQGAAASSTSPVPVRQALPALRAGENGLETLVQREINSFVMESFGKFLKPGLLSSIRRNVDERFTDADLDRLLAAMFPNVGTIPAAAPREQGNANDIRQASTVLPEEAATVQTGAPRSAAEDPTETIIRIIMDATGYDRDEIEPEMDLREDLNIRSSRLPVIMDSVEGHFGIKIELEDFMDVRTIRDISDRLTVIISRGKKKPPALKAPRRSIEQTESPELVASENAETLKRIAFRKVISESVQLQPVELNTMDTVIVFSATRGAGLRKKVGDVLRRDYGAHIVPMTFLDETDPESGGFDLRTKEGVDYALQNIAGNESVAGLVFLLDEALESGLKDDSELTGLLTGFFSVLKSFLESPAKKFTALLYQSGTGWKRSEALAEGVLGMFLSAALEYSSVQFRTLGLTTWDDLRDGLRSALDRGRKHIELMFSEEEVFTREGYAAPAQFPERPNFELTGEDVIVFTGGCSGIVPYLADSLVPFGPKMVFMGRTPYEEGAQDGKAADIIRTLESLREKGITADYTACDVSDSEAVDAALGQISRKHGCITGLVHGAGFLRDNFIRNLTAVDFNEVIRVKCLGLMNLLTGVPADSLKFVAALSSAAAVQGNPGQSNYSAANRMMTALTVQERRLRPFTVCKSLMLPPIEGAGMAENSDVRDLMKLMNASYVHADELKELFCRELFLAPPREARALFMRSLPDIATVRLDPSRQEHPEELLLDGVAVKSENFPMIDSVAHADLRVGALTAHRTFSPDKDLWINDHQPFKFMKYPLVSAIMAVETFFEACRCLYPHLHCGGISDAHFLDIIECPPGSARRAEITCRLGESARTGNVCEVTLAAAEISPTGRDTGKLNPKYKGSVIMLGAPMEFPEEIPGFPVRDEELDSRPMDPDEVLAWYAERTDMQDRYRVMESLDGSGECVVRGHFVCTGKDDFAAPLKTVYQYSPYLLEALMQLVNFHIVMRDTSERRSMIPFAIGEMRFSRKAAPGERITLEARMSRRDAEGIVWNARASSASGETLMITRDLRMKWFPK